jgi:hypothetical protein
MTELLKIGLELAFNEDTSRRKRLIEKIPKTYMLEHDGKQVNARELLQGTSIAGTNFVPAEVLNTVIEGAKLAVCFRGTMPEYRTTSDTYAIPVGSGGGYAKKYAPGAPVEFREDALATRPVTIYNYKELPAVTDEMIADAKVDEIAREIELAGIRIENALNQDMLTVLLDNSGQEHDTAGSNQGYKAVVKAQVLLEKAGFYPNVVVACPEAKGMLLNDLVPSGYAGAEDALLYAKLNALGMQLKTCSVADNSSTYAWEYNSDGDIGMLVMDTRSAGAIVMRQDIQMEDYKDTLRGIVGAKATMRAGVQYAQANATARIEY